MDYSGKVAIITGGANGIGLGIATQCAKEKMKIVLADINDIALENACQELTATGAEVIGKKTDVTKEQDWKDLVDLTMNTFGKIDFFFSNAGISFHKSLEAATDAEWDWVFNVNFWSHVKAIREILPIMKSQDSGGHITFTSSIGAIGATMTMVPYACTKSALVSLAEGLRAELDATQMSKVKLSVVLPGGVATNIQDQTFTKPKDVPGADDNASELDLAFKNSIGAEHKGASLGGANTFSGMMISKELAGERILDQMKRGYFYIYTSRNSAKNVLMKRSYAMLMDEQPINVSRDIQAYYVKKLSVDPDFQELVRTKGVNFGIRWT
ncbi:MAG TPA: SDR family oxidoreductase [Ktedonobacteraceae bacterium]|nr:SDR family oxidoreductase [Ktedonobacteraceae bacterium]